MEKQQRNKAQAECASSAERRSSWKRIDFARCERKVRKLQVRIAKAQKERRYNKVKALQHLLATSFEAKVLTVRKVTTNKRKRTAGVDHVLWDTDAKKINAVCSLKRRGHRTLPLKRVNIPKKNGKMRPLGIPTMKDRAMQALYLMALEPCKNVLAKRQKRRHWNNTARPFCKFPKLKASPCLRVVIHGTGSMRLYANWAARR